MTISPIFYGYAQGAGYLIVHGIHEGSHALEGVFDEGLAHYKYSKLTQLKNQGRNYFAALQDVELEGL